MNIVTSIADLQIAFDSIQFVSDHKKRNMVTISHPKFRDDGHKIGITFRKINFQGSDTWELASTNLVIVQHY